MHRGRPHQQSREENRAPSQDMNPQNLALLCWPRLSNPAHDAGHHQHPHFLRAALRGATRGQGVVCWSSPNAPVQHLGAS